MGAERQVALWPTIAARWLEAVPAPAGRSGRCAGPGLAGSRHVAAGDRLGLLTLQQPDAPIHLLGDRLTLSQHPR